jgi:hypothetical protein
MVMLERSCSEPLKTVPITRTTVPTVDGSAWAARDIPRDRAERAIRDTTADRREKVLLGMFFYRKPT